MSRFFSSRFSTLTPYVPGEQPKDQQYIKLNTNESPFPPAPEALEMAAEAARQLQLYPDPECSVLVQKLAKLCGVSPEQVILGNGSDELLNFAFMAFGDDAHPFLFPSISYGFYPVYAEINHLPYTEVPLRDDFTVDLADYKGKNSTVILANPNAPTGIALNRSEIETLLQANPNNVVIIDEAYVDFGGESCIPLVNQYENLLVIQTFSKSRSMAGARLGFAVGSPALIRDLNTIKYSNNPYNINRMTMAAGIGVLESEDYTQANCRTIMDNRTWTTNALQALGFTVLDSKANFIFARHPDMDGEALYLELKRRGILIRHFTKPEICQWNRITIGTLEQMQALVNTIRSIQEEAL